MSEWYDDKQDSVIIEMIFNQIILNKFKAEYISLMDYNYSSYSYNYYQNLVFKTSDLMYNIFQYLQCNKHFNGDLFNASLVNSYWLYYI